MTTSNKWGSIGSEITMDIIFIKSVSNNPVLFLRTSFCTSSNWSNGSKRGDVWPSNEQCIMSFRTSYPSYMDCLIRSTRLATKESLIMSSNRLDTVSTLWTNESTLYSRLSIRLVKSAVVTLSWSIAIELLDTTKDIFWMASKFALACCWVDDTVFSSFLILYSNLIVWMNLKRFQITLTPLWKMNLVRYANLFGLGISLAVLL